MPDDELSDQERTAITALQRLGRRWPRSLTLASMDGTLVVIRTGDSRFVDDDTDRTEAVVADIHGIPNTGGGW